MFYTVYKITNNINGKTYIGKHQTDNLDDGYMGSGKLIRRAIAKYGAENFTKEILHAFENQEEMNAKEKELVIVSEETYNLCDGGNGGFGYINRNGLVDHIANGHKGKHALKPFNKEELIQNGTYDHWREQVSIGVKKYFRENESWWTGRHHKEETKKKIGAVTSKAQRGEGNSQFGTRWITDGITTVKIRKQEPIPAGWRTGRSLS